MTYTMGNTRSLRSISAVWMILLSSVTINEGAVVVKANPEDLAFLQQYPEQFLAPNPVSGYYDQSQPSFSLLPQPSSALTPLGDDAGGRLLVPGQDLAALLTAKVPPANLANSE